MSSPGSTSVVSAAPTSRLSSLGPEDAQSFYRSFLVWYATWTRPTYLEIGCSRGETCWLLYEHCRSIDAVDVLKYGSWAEHAATFPNLHYFEMESDRFFWLMSHAVNISRPGYDLVFIDGDHDKYQVVEDTLNALKFLNPDGLIVLHDTHPPTEDHTHSAWCGTAYQALDTLRSKDLDLQVFTFPVTYGLTLVSKQPTLPWLNKDS